MISHYSTPDRVLHGFQKAYPRPDWNTHRLHHERLRNAWFYGHLWALMRRDVPMAAKCRTRANEHQRSAYERRTQASKGDGAQAP